MEVIILTILVESIVDTETNENCLRETEGFLIIEGDFLTQC